MSKITYIGIPSMGFAYLEQYLFFNKVDNFSCFKPLENYPVFFCDKINEFEYDFYGYVSKGETLLFDSKRTIKSSILQPNDLPEYYGFERHTSSTNIKYPKLIPLDLERKIKKSSYNLIQTQTRFLSDGEKPWIFENKILLKCIRDTNVIVPTRKLYRLLIRKVRDSTHLGIDLLSFYFIDKKEIFRSLDNYLHVNKILLKCLDMLSIRYKFFDMEVYDTSILNLSKSVPWDGIQEGKSHTFLEYTQVGIDRMKSSSTTKYNDQIVFDCVDEYMKLRNYTEDTYLHEI